MKRLFRIAHLCKDYPASGKNYFGKRTARVPALKDISLDIMLGECLALVGESGSGKTTLGHALLRLIKPDGGAIFYQDCDILKMPEKQFRRLRPRFQIIFQNHAQALNPRQTIASCLSEPLAVHTGLAKSQIADRVHELLHSVDLDEELLKRLPHQLSGGQRQRIAIARALATGPAFIVADEPTSSLDASVKGDILKLLKDLQRRLGITLLLITHDLGVVARIADRVAVLLRGEIVELGNVTSMLNSPRHPYTQLLVRSACFGQHDGGQQPLVVSDLDCDLPECADLLSSTLS